MWLNTIHHMLVPLKNHHHFRAILVPNKDAPTITAAENKVLTPEISFLDLKKTKKFSIFTLGCLRAPA